MQAHLQQKSRDNFMFNCSSYVSPLCYAVKISLCPINSGVICLREIGNRAIEDPSWTNVPLLNGRALDKLLLTVN